MLKMQKIKKSKISRAVIVIAALSIVFVGTFASFADEYAEPSAYVRVKGSDYTLGDLDGDGYIEDSQEKGKLKMTHAAPTLRPLDGDETSQDSTTVGETTENPEISGDTSANTDGTLTDDRPLTTVPRTTTQSPSTTVAPSTTGANIVDNGNDDGGFNWLGLIIGIIVAAVIVLIVILLIPKKERDTTDRKN